MEPALIQKLSREVFDPDSIYFQYVLPERQRGDACLNEAYHHIFKYHRHRVSATSVCFQPWLGRGES